MHMLAYLIPLNSDGELDFDNIIDSEVVNSYVFDEETQREI